MSSRKTPSFRSPAPARRTFSWRNGAAARILAGIAVTGGLIANHAAQATGYTDTGGNGNFSGLITPNPNTTPPSTSFTDTLTFSGTTASTQVDDITVPLDFNVLTFANSALYTLNKGAGTFITLGGTNPTINFNAGAGNTIDTALNLDLVLNATTTITFASPATTVGSASLNGVISGAGGLTFTGTNNTGGANGIVLTGRNTYTGGTIVNTGSTVSPQNSSALGTGPVTVNNNGNILLQGVGVVYNQNFIINGTGSTTAGKAGALRGSSYAGGTYNPATIAGTVTLGSNALIGSNGPGTDISGAINLGTFTLTHGTASLLDFYTGNITGTGLTVNNSAGGGTGSVNQILALTGTNSIGTITLTLGSVAGTTTSLQGGTIATSGTGNVIFDQTLPSQVVGPGLVAGPNINSGSTNVVITGGGAVIKNNAGTAILTGNNGYTGATTVNGGTLTFTGTNTGSAPTVNGGTLRVDYSGAATGNILDATKPLTVAGGTFNVNGNATTAQTQTFANLAVGAGASTVSTTNNGGGGGLVFTSGTITRAAPGGTVNFAPGTGTITLTGNTSNAFIGPYAFFNGTGYAATNSSGNVTAATATPVAGVNSFGSPTANYADTLTTGTDTETTTGAAANTVIFTPAAGGQSIELGANSLTLNGFINNGPGTLTIQSTTGGGTGTLNIGTAVELVVGGAGSLNVSVPIQNNGSTASALTLNNSGTTTLTGVSSYTGATTVSGGTLVTNNLASGATNSGIGAGTALNLNGGALRYTGTTAVGTGTTTTGVGNFDRAIAVGANGATIDNASGTGGSTTSTGSSITVSGAFTGPGPLTILDSTGHSDEVLVTTTAGNGGLTGNVTVGSASANSGFLQDRTSGANPFGTGTVTVNAGGTVSADTGTTTPGTLANNLILNGGMLATQAPNVSYSGLITLAATSSVGHILNGTGTISLVNEISGAGGLNVVTGAGSTAPSNVTISGANTYAGGTTVTNALLTVGGGNPTDPGNGLGTGAITVNGTANSAVPSLTEGVLRLAAPGTTLRLNAINDTAPITLNGGTINTQNASEGVSNGTAAPTQGLGTLSLTNPAGTFSFIDYSTGSGTTANDASSTLAFAGVGPTFTGQLQVVNYDFNNTGNVSDHLYIGTTPTLTQAQLAQISFTNINGVAGNNLGAMQLANGEITPTPEPGGLLPLVFGIAGTGVLIARKRRAKKGEQAATAV